MTVVVDSSIAVKWLITEHDSQLANYLLRFWRRQRVERVIPNWALLEVANSLLQCVARGEFSDVDAVTHLSELPRFVTLIESSSDHSGRAFMYAHRLGLRTLYDLHFLVLAEDLGCELWTADERFWQTVSKKFPFVKWLGHVAV